MKLSKNTLAAAVIAGCSVAFAGAANALPSFASGLVPGQNSISDDDVEVFIDNDADGLVSVGDYFLGYIGFNTMQPSNEQPGTTVNEATAMYALEVSTAPAPIPAGLCGNQASNCVAFDLTLPGVGLAAALDSPIPALAGASFDYDPSVAGTQSAATLLAGIDASTWLVAFEDATPDFNVITPDQQSLVYTVIDGVISLELGITGATINAFGPDDPLEILTANPGQAIGGFTIASAPIVTTLWPLDTSTPVNGGGQVFAPSSGNAFGIKTNTDITVFAVPAPGVLALMGVGLLGLGFTGRNRKNA